MASHHFRRKAKSSFSPQGKIIIFAARRNHHFRHKAEPSFSPQGKIIIFAARRKAVPFTALCEKNTG
ncbi:MAG: PD40 domain-containing protein [Clostridia bacterium]|nr:PD40 domain-containing protein [Clostridia bacterium]